MEVEEDKIINHIIIDKDKDIDLIIDINNITEEDIIIIIKTDFIH